MPTGTMLGSELQKEISVCFRELVPEIPSTTYGTFGLYRYPAKFIPQVIAYVLKHYKHPGMRVFDPFAGCGTAGLVSRMHGLDYELWDLNPMLDILHSIAVMDSVNIDAKQIISRISASKKEFTPSWSRLTYWFPPEILSFLFKVWGFYHALEESKSKHLLLVPLLKATRGFSYNDPQRQKLSRSPLADKRVASLLKGDWKSTYLKILTREIEMTTRKIKEYQDLSPKNSSVQSIVRGGIDAVDASFENSNFTNEWDILITSPPYLQAQEYIRNAKLDLFWLGYSEDEVRQLSKKELPYRDVALIPIYSKTYMQYYNMVTEPHLRKMFERYFHGVLGILTRLSVKVSEYLFLFVGPASVRSIPVPIDRIFTEHFTELGWLHEATLLDPITSRVMFRSNANPATGLKDNRIRTEQLIILRRPS